MALDLNDTYIKRWLTGLAPKTKEGYLGLIKDWWTFINLSPTEIINKRMHDLTSTDLTERTFFESKFIEYKESLEATGLNSDSNVHDKIKVVSSFFTRNNLKLSYKKGDWKSTQKQNVTEKKEKLSLDDIKRMYGHANLRDKCLLLILAQSGFSEIDIAELKIENIKDLYSMAINEHYVIEKNREKTNHLQATCLSYEFLHDLRQLLSESGNPTQGFIFTSQTVQETETQISKEEKEKLNPEQLKQYEEQQAQARKEAKEKRLSPIDTRRISEIIKNLAEKTFETKKAKEFQTKILRSFYNSALLRAKIQPQEIKDLMMGHDQGGARKNYDHDDETIKEAYIQVFEFLSINGLQSRNDLVAIKETMKQQSNYLVQLITEMKNENTQQKERMAKLEIKLTELGVDVGTIKETSTDLNNRLSYIEKKTKTKKPYFDQMR